MSWAGMSLTTNVRSNLLWVNWRRDTETNISHSCLFCITSGMRNVHNRTTLSSLYRKISFQKCSVCHQATSSADSILLCAHRLLSWPGQSKKWVIKLPIAPIKALYSSKQMLSKYIYIYMHRQTDVKLLYSYKSTLLSDMFYAVMSSHIT